VVQLQKPGAEAVADKGWLLAHKWLLARRLSQLSILLLFLLGPWVGIWIIKGTLSSSMTLDILPLTDPYLLLQSLFAGHTPETVAITGALIMLAFYLAVGGRVYCSWVCPVNIITDVAYWLREKLGITTTTRLSRNTRYWILGMTLLLATLTGTMAWELVNPVTMVHRGLIFGMGMAWSIVIAVFLLDLFISKRAWCGHLCPVGAFYSLLGVYSPLRVNAMARDRCNDCMDCFAVCPEPQVIPPALKGAEKGVSPIITSSNCTNCGRCIDVCSKDVFAFGSRFDKKLRGFSVKPSHHKMEVLS
jgi:ferredoxin-type protein NapH